MGNTHHVDDDFVQDTIAERNVCPFCGHDKINLQSTDGGKAYTRDLYTCPKCHNIWMLRFECIGLEYEKDGKIVKIDREDVE